MAEFGWACLTVTLILSPTNPKILLPVPMTRITETTFAPLLSATFSLE
jgi:hypothetical protein